MRSHRFVLAGLAAALASWGTTAMAQGTNGANIDLNPFRPAMDSRGYITINASQVLGHKEVSFGLVTNWGRNLLVFESDDGSGPNTYEVLNIISPTLVAALGLKLGPVELEIGGSLPTQVMNGDRDPDFLAPNDPNNNQKFGFEGQGLGNVGLHLKARFLNAGRSPVGVAVIGSLYLPTASTEDRWIGEGELTPQVMGVVDTELGKGGRFKVALTGGVRLRQSTVTFVDSGLGGTPAPPVTNQTLAVGTTIPFGVGIAYALSPQRFDVVGEIFGALPLEGENYFPLEAIGGIKVYLARNSFLSLGAGTGLLPGKAGSPDLRAFMGIVFEPNIGDRDGDGIKDDVDRCPAEAEDVDGFEDEDGCPDPDNDRDGIPDVDDQCPNVPEDKDDFEDEDGCPDGDAFDRDGDGIKDDVDQCPDVPEDKDGFEDEDGCPDPDNDGDGVLDVDDLCPDDAEDFDKFEDVDGCPDPDNDEDRFLDEDDKCPNDPETYNGYRDDDGCPDRGRVVVTDTEIKILDKVYFEYNRAAIKRQSYPILDAVVGTLQGNPGIRLVEIQGHTDERGSDSYNLQLSEERAQSVRQYMVDKGVSPDRLRGKGYGESKPVDPAHNEAAWGKNRRVEFLIVKRASEF